MALVMEGTAIGRGASDRNGTLVATVLVLDGRVYADVAAGFAADPDVLNWQAHALNTEPSGVAVLFYRDLELRRRTHRP